MLRRLFILGSALSLLLCVAACVLWVKVARGPDQRSLSSAFLAPMAARYTLRAEDERLVLYGPPELAPATLEGGTARTRMYWGGQPYVGYADHIPACTALPADLARQIRNSDLEWDVFREAQILPFGQPKASLHFSPRGRVGSATCQLAPRAPAIHDSQIPVEFPDGRLPPYTLAETARPLLAALEDEDRWIAAHVTFDWILESTAQPGLPKGYNRPSTDGFKRQPAAENRFVCDIDGLRADLTGHGPQTYWSCCSMLSGTTQACEATIAPSQRAALIEQWHRRLDVPVASMPPWGLTAVTAVLPLTWFGLFAARVSRRANRRRRGLCLHCGYDMRGTTQRCPECGTPAEGDRR